MALMWVAALWGLILPAAALFLGRLRPRRDLFFLMIYGQAWLYVHFAPLFTAREVNLATQQRYIQFEWWALLLFDLVFLLGYLRTVGSATADDRPRFQLRLPATSIFVGGSLFLGIGYLTIAVTRGLLTRRLGVEMSALQLELPLWEFATYRLFIELGPFLIALHVLFLRLGTQSAQAIALLRASLALTVILFLSYALANNRLAVIITVSVLYGVVQTTMPPRPIRATTVVTGLLVGVCALYLVRVTENVREGFGTGMSLFDPAHLDPFPSRAGDLNPDNSLRWRLNGLDLVAIIADNVEAQGPAWGTAWAAPFVLSLDPIIRTPLTLELKRAGLTTAKSYLLIQYGGWAKTDYFSCMLTDAYGNFGLLGFFLAGLVLAMVVGHSTRALQVGTSPAAMVFAVFYLLHILPFEREFGNVIFGWLKLIPVAIALAVVNPLRALTPLPVARARAPVEPAPFTS